jgi:uncharacterized SAM-binding protein YcdF (DUF218 family)
VLLFNKVLPLFFLPFGIVCALILVALWRKKWWPGLVALAILYLASIPLVGDRLLGLLERRYPEIPVAQAGPADAIVVLGGILGGQTSPDTMIGWSESVERFEAGVALVQAGRAEELIFMGAKRQWLGRETTEGDELRRLAIARGVPAEKILVTRHIDNTATEAAAVAERVKAGGRKRVIVVTTGWHMPRAMLLFRKAGVDALPFPVDLRTERARSIGLGDFVPNASSWLMTETAIRECYGYAFYRIFR